MNPIRIVSIIEAHRTALLQNFCNYYRERVDEIHLFVQIEDDGFDLRPLRELVPGVELHRWPHPYASHLQRFHRHAYARIVFNSGWLLPIDSDEFVNAPVREVVAEMENSGWDYAEGIFVDRIAANGSLPPMEVGDPHAQFPVRARLTKHVVRGKCEKVWLVRWPHWGHHYFVADGSRNYMGRTREHDQFSKHPTVFTIDHFKWDESALNRLEKRYEDHSRNGVPWKREPKRFLEYWHEHGRIDIDSVRLPE